MSEYEFYRDVLMHSRNRKLNYWLSTFVIAAFVLIVGGALLLACTGCKSAQQTAEEHRLVMETYADTVKAMGVEAWVFGNLPIRAGLQTKTEFGSDGNVTFLIHFNPLQRGAPDFPTTQPAGATP